MYSCSAVPNAAFAESGNCCSTAANARAASIRTARIESESMGASRRTRSAGSALSSAVTAAERSSGFRSASTASAADIALGDW